jgi:hypothetical protein
MTRSSPADRQPHGSISLPFSLLRIQSIQLSLLAIDLSLLRLDLLLHGRILVLPFLHLVPNHRATEEAYCGTDAGSRSGISGRAADDRAQASSAKRADGSAFLPRRQRFGAAENKCAQQQGKYQDY